MYFTIRYFFVFFLALCRLNIFSSEEPSFCETSISKTPGFENNQCEIACNKEDFSTFNTNCIKETYTLRDDKTNVKPDGLCYHQWIHGYSYEQFLAKRPSSQTVVRYATLSEYLAGNSDENNLLAGLYIPNIETAHKCQQKCQEDPDCEGFVQHVATNTPPQSGTNNENSINQGCLLKTETMIRLSRSTILEETNYPVDRDNPTWRYCDMDLTEKCFNSMECLKCNENIICVWSGGQYIAGPKYCTGLETDICNVEGISGSNNMLSGTTNDIGTFGKLGEHPAEKEQLIEADQVEPLIEGTKNLLTNKYLGLRKIRRITDYKNSSPDIAEPPKPYTEPYNAPEPPQEIPNPSEAPEVRQAVERQDIQESLEPHNTYEHLNDQEGVESLEFKNRQEVSNINEVENEQLSEYNDHSENPEQSDHSGNQEYDPNSENPEQSNHSENQEYNPNSENPEQNDHSENPEQSDHSGNQEYDPNSENPEHNDHSENPEQSDHSGNQEYDPNSENPEQSNHSENQEYDPNSENPEHNDHSGTHEYEENLRAHEPANNGDEEVQHFGSHAIKAVEDVQRSQEHDDLNAGENSQGMQNEINSANDNEHLESDRFDKFDAVEDNENAQEKNV